MADHTPGPWLRAGRTVYALMHTGWHKGAEQFKNRITITVQYDRECSEAEAEACARLVEASPDLLKHTAALLKELDSSYGITPEDTEKNISALLNSSDLAAEYIAARSAVRKATGGAG